MKLSISVWLAAAALAICSGGAHAAPSVFVVNSNDASIDMIDLVTHQITRTIPLLREPHHLVLSPDGKSLVWGTRRAIRFFCWTLALGTCSAA